MMHVTIIVKKQCVVMVLYNLERVVTTGIFKMQMHVIIVVNLPSVEMVSGKIKMVQVREV